jgi:hypothetical protein
MDEPEAPDSPAEPLPELPPVEEPPPAPSPEVTEIIEQIEKPKPGPELVFDPKPPVKLNQSAISKVINAAAKRRVDELRTEHKRLLADHINMKQRSEFVNRKFTEFTRKFGQVNLTKPIPIVSKSGEQFAIKFHQYLPEIVANFFGSQFRNSRRLESARRYADNDLLTAFTVYVQSPACYSYLSKLFALPPMDALNRWIDRARLRQNARINTGEYENTVLACMLMKEGEMYCNRSPVSALVPMGTQPHQIQHQMLQIQQQQSVDNQLQHQHDHQQDEEMHEVDLPIESHHQHHIIDASQLPNIVNAVVLAEDDNTVVVSEGFASEAMEFEFDALAAAVAQITGSE